MSSDISSSSGLVRSLSLTDAIMVGVASMIGGAIFVLVGPGMVAAGPALMIAFLLNGLITVFTALTYAELGSALPSTGGGYKWVREGLPRPHSYLSGWMAWFAHSIAGSLYAVAFGSFFGHLLKISSVFGDLGEIPIDKIFAGIAILLFVFVNVRGASSTGKVGSVITLTQLGIIALLIGAAFFAMLFTNPTWPDNFSDFFPNGSIGLVVAMGITFIAFEGYEIIAQGGSEIKNPKKNIPKAILISLGIVVSIYVVFSFAFIAGLNSETIGQPAWEFIGSFGELGIIESAKFFLPFGALIVLGGGLVSTLSALNATTFASSRVSFAMGTQYNLPHAFGKIHPKFKTPYVATIISGIIMMIIALTMDLTQIAIAASVMFLFLFTQVNLASITIRRLYAKKIKYEFKTPFFPLFPIIGIILAIGLSIYLLFTHPQSWAIAIVWIFIGFIIYKFYTSKKEIEHYAPTVFNQGPEERKKNRILILHNKKNTKQLLAIASAISKEYDSEISFLNVIKVPLQIPLSLAQGFGKNGMNSFDELKKSIPHSIRHRYLVRLSHDTTEALLATVEEQETNTLIVDFEYMRNNRKLLSLSTCDIVGAHFQNYDEKFSNIVVSYDKGRHSNLGLKLGVALSKTYESNLRIVRGIVESPEEELEILNKINEMMFDLELKKIPFEKVYPKKKDVTNSLLKNFRKYRSDIIIVGAGNQSNQAFSPKTMRIVDNSEKTVLVVRNHLFSDIHARTLWKLIESRLKENRYFYRFYVELLQFVHKLSTNGDSARYDEDYFNSKISKS